MTVPSLRLRLRTLRARRRRGVLGMALLLGCLGVVTRGPGNDDSDHDIRQTLHVRQVLLKDPQLAHLNLGVRVRNRVATLWGPVPSAELGFKAERVLRGLYELAEVHNELEVGGEPAPPVAPAPAPTAPSFLPAQLPPALPARPPANRGIL